MVRSYHTYKVFDVEGFNGSVCRNCEMPLQQGAGCLIVCAPSWRHALDTILSADLCDIVDGPIRTRVLTHLVQQGKLFCQRYVPAMVPNGKTYGKPNESTTEIALLPLG